MIVTATEFAELHSVDYAIAANTLRFLVGKGIVCEAESRPTATGKGRASTLFNVPDMPVTLSLSKMEDFEQVDEYFGHYGDCDCD